MWDYQILIAGGWGTASNFLLVILLDSMCGAECVMGWPAIALPMLRSRLDGGHQQPDPEYLRGRKENYANDDGESLATGDAETKKTG